MNPENYIKHKMEQGTYAWNRALEAYDTEDYKTAANLFAKAMQLYYGVAQDLLDGTGWKKGV